MKFISAKVKKIPLVTVPRLSVYYRALLGYSGYNFISSAQLAELTGVTAAQVRKDFAYFGQFGTPGKGYQAEELKRTILKILGTDKQWNVVLVGAGNLGSALLSYKGFGRLGFKIKCAFDNDPHKIGKDFGGIAVQDTKRLKTSLKKEDVRIAIVTVPQDAAQKVVDTLIRVGVRAILNFAPTRLYAPKDVQILNIDLPIEMERLAYFLTHQKRF